jgi:hypothetical protein
MKTFEESFTAWVDGELRGDDLAVFEQEMAGSEDVMSERANTVKLGALLREHGAAPPLTNEDFFNRSLMERIYAERPTVPLRSGEAVEQKTWWGLPKLVWVGGACLAASMIILPLIVPVHRDHDTAKTEIDTQTGNEATPFGGNGTGDAYVAEVLEATSGDPSVSAVALHLDDNKVTVVWLDGLDYIPASNQITASNRAN